MWGPLAAYLIGFHLLPVPDSIDLFLWIGLLLAALQLFFKKARVLLLMALFLWLGLFRSTGGSVGKDQLQPRAEVVLLQPRGEVVWGWWVWVPFYFEDKKKVCWYHRHSVTPGVTVKLLFAMRRRAAQQPAEEVATGSDAPKQAAAAEPGAAHDVA